MGPKISKYLDNITSFHKIPKYSIYWTQSGYDNATCHMVWMSKDLDTLKIVQFVCLGEKIGENVLKYFGIWKIYQNTTIFYNVFSIQANHDLVSKVNPLVLCFFLPL
jgi:hypothetical protein